MLNEKVFCNQCEQEVHPIVKEEINKATIEDKKYSFKVKTVLCERCGCEIFIPEIERQNMQSLYEEYIKLNPDGKLSMYCMLNSFLVLL